MVKLSAPVKSLIIPDIDTAAGRTSGAIEFVDTSKGDKTGRKYSGLIYRCPCGCGSQGFLAFRPMSPEEEAHPSWEWNGDEELPDLNPSINHVGHWHGFLEKGYFVQKKGQKNGEART